MNVVAYRLIQNRSIITPRSYCPHCKKTILFYDNIPVLSWLLLKGQCRTCLAPISVLYPAIELFTAIILLLLYAVYNNHYFFSYGIFFSALIVTIRSDIETMLISRFATLFLVPVGIVCATINMLPISTLESVLGAVCGYFYLYVINNLYKRLKGHDGIGEGDFDLLALVGSFTGIMGVWFTVLAGALLGVVVGVPYLLWLKKERATQIPFGPFLAVGALLFVLGRFYLVRLL